MTIEHIGIILGCVFLGVMIIGGFRARAWEKREWNGGVCADNGLRWEQFDTDSQGGRGYKAGARYTWISYPGVDKAET